MQSNPAEDWQRLTEHYREIGDGELQELAADFADLTETAQQVLRNEMRNRGLDDPCAAHEAPQSPERPTAPRWASAVDPDRAVNRSDAPDANEENDLPCEYTWKTPLCECDTAEQAWQIYEVLRRAGIESWIEQPGSQYALELSGPRVVVAADQLDQALEIAARPIPQDIIEESRQDVAEYEAPTCPHCGAADPVLESVDPTNSWLCEACGEQWTEAAVGPNGKPAQVQP